MKEKLSFVWTFLIDRFRVTLLLLMITLVAGVASYVALPREITPTIDIPVANIITVWPGANPGDVENLITKKIEKELKGLENTESYTSSSRSGLSIITVEFQLGTNKIENMQRLRDRVDAAKRDLPSSLPADPQINEISFSDIALLSLTLSGDYSWSELKTFAQIIQEELETIPQVKDVQLKGVPEDKMHIVIDPLKLQALDLTVSQVTQMIRSAHQDMPLGQISLNGQDIEITLQGEMKTAQDFQELPLKNIDGALIKLSDIAEVRREFADFETETFFSRKKEAYPAVFISMIKSAAKGNVITMVEEAFEKIEKLKEEKKLTGALNIDVTFNRGQDIQESLDTLMGNGKQTLLLIALAMLLALGWKESLLASLSIPVSLMIGVTVLYLLGETFNGISLFALVLSIGLLVDNAIIIVEGMYQGIYEKKLSPQKAAHYALETFRWPIIAGTLTTLFAFLPMLFFITGISGQFIRIIPIAVMTVLGGALLMTLFLLPSLGVQFYKKFPLPQKNKESSSLLRKTQKKYESFMKNILYSPMKTSGVLIVSFLILLGSVSLVFTGKVQTEVFPPSDQTVFGAEVRFPQGTSLEKTKTLIPVLEKALEKYFEPQENGEIWLKNVIFTAGDSPSVGEVQAANVSRSHILGITLNLTSTQERQTESFDIAPLIGKDLKSVIPSSLEFEVFEDRGGPPSGAAIEIDIQSDDLARLDILSSQIVENLEKIDGLVNISDSRAEKITQVTWKFQREKMSQLGISPSFVRESLRAWVNGVTVVQILEGEDRIDVDLRIDTQGDKKWASPESLDVLGSIPLQSQTGEWINFEDLATPVLSSPFSNIERKEGERIITVSADVKRGTTASLYAPEIQKIFQEIDLLPGESLSLGGDNEEGNRIIQEMLAAMLAAVLLIFLVLVWQFNSFYQPLIILVLIPLSLSSVFIGFWLMDIPIGFPTMIGILALAGIIVNNAIVLIDRINHKHQTDPQDPLDGYILAGKERMQPIFLTSLTTVVGLIPLSLSDPFWMGLGFAIIFGMAISTILTLVLIPCIMVTLQRIGNAFLGIFQKKVR